MFTARERRRAGSQGTQTVFFFAPRFQVNILMISATLIITTQYLLLFDIFQPLHTFSHRYAHLEKKILLLYRPLLWGRKKSKPENVISYIKYKDADEIGWLNIFCLLSIITNQLNLISVHVNFNIFLPIYICISVK